MCLCEQLAECYVIHVLVRGRDNVGEGNRRVVELAEVMGLGLITCEGGVDVVGVVTPLFTEVRRFCMAIRLSSSSVLLEVQEREEKGEDGEGQIEVESERGELKERRTCTWMT